MVACLCSLYKLKGKIIHDIITDIGFKIKKGWNINIDARSIHHDPTVHKDPDVFNPSRFPVSLPLGPFNYSFFIFLPFLLTPNDTSCNIIIGQEKRKFNNGTLTFTNYKIKMLEKLQAESKPYSFLAFGMGGRTCLGKNMAKAMMLVFLHRFITNYK